MTMDPQSAVAALEAAKDIEALVAAIEQASFLDATPGDNRQKLRGMIEMSRGECCLLYRVWFLWVAQRSMVCPLSSR